MAISLHASLQDPVGVVDAARVSLETEEHLPGRGRAVDAVQSVRSLPHQVGQHSSYKGERRLSSPARWSLWMWLKKHAKGGRRAGCARKKSTAGSVSARIPATNSPRDQGPSARE